MSQPNTQFKNQRVVFGETQSASGYIVRQKWTNPVAASATYILTGVTTATTTTTFAHQPDFPRLLSITSGGASHNATGNVVINGTDIRGASISDTIALNGNTTVNGVKAFASVTSVDTTGVSGIGASATVQVGVAAGLGLKRLMIADEYINGSAAGTYESTRATITYDSSDISKNTVTFNTAPNGSTTFRAVYVSTELTSSKATTA